MTKILASSEVEKAKIILRELSKENEGKTLPGVNEHNCFFALRVSVNADSPPSCLLNGCSFPFVAVVTLGTAFGSGLRVVNVSGRDGGDVGDLRGKMVNSMPGDVTVFGVGVEFQHQKIYYGDRYQLEFFLAG